MTRRTVYELNQTMNSVFEIQAVLQLISKRLETAGDLGGPDENELMSLSRAADCCVRSLETVAEALGLWAENEAKRVA